jgi:EmrB/QacA subfamily drug resistance transporter
VGVFLIVKTMNKPRSASSNTTGIIIVSILAAFLPPYMASSLNVALPTIGREFAMPAVSLSWLITSYLLAIAVGIIPFGKAGDLYGRRGVFLWGTVAYTVTTLCAGCVASSTALLVMRVLQGIGAAMIFSTGAALLVSVVPASKRGSMLGLNVASTYIGLSAGPSLGGFLTQHFGWRSIFFTSAPLGLLIVFVVLLRVRDDRPAHPHQSFDIAGAVVYGAALSGLMIGLPNLMSLWGGIITGVGAVLAGLFLFVESRVSAPIVHLELFKRSTVFAYSNLAALLNYSATHGAGFLMSLYLQYVKGMPPRNAGLVMIFWPLLMAVFSPLAGRLSDRVEPRIVASGGMALTACSLFYLCTIGEVTPLYRIIAGLVLLGIGIAFFSSPNTSAIMGSVEKQFYGMATSMVGTARLIGQMLSMGIVAFVMNAFVGNSAITFAVHPAFIRSIQVSFVVFGVLCLLGVFASLGRGRLREKKVKGEDPLLDVPVAG